MCLGYLKVHSCQLSSKALNFRKCRFPYVAPNISGCPCLEGDHEIMVFSRDLGLELLEQILENYSSLLLLRHSQHNGLLKSFIGGD
jgi:hypothetical protein